MFVCLFVCNSATNTNYKLCRMWRCALQTDVCCCRPRCLAMAVTRSAGKLSIISIVSIVSIAYFQGQSRLLVRPGFAPGRGPWFLSVACWPSAEMQYNNRYWFLAFQWRADGIIDCPPYIVYNNDNEFYFHRRAFSLACYSFHSKLHNL